MTRRVVKIDSITRDVIETYADDREAARANGLIPSRVSQACKAHRFPNGGRTILRYEDEYTRDEEWTARTSSPLYVTDGRRVRCFYDAGHASEELGFSVNTIKGYIYKGKGIGLRWGRMKRGLDQLVEQLRKEAANG